MTDKVKAALILGAALIVAALLNGGIYQIVPASTNDSARAYRLNRFTGSVEGILGFMKYPVEELPVRSSPTSTATPR